MFFFCNNTDLSRGRMFQMKVNDGGGQSLVNMQMSRLQTQAFRKISCGHAAGFKRLHDVKNRVNFRRLLVQGCGGVCRRDSQITVVG